MMDFFFFNDTATTEIYTLSLHDALPIQSDLARNINAFVQKVEKSARADHVIGIVQEIEIEIGRAHV